MPFDFHNKDRIKNLLEELEELRYHSLQEIPEFLWYEDDKKTGNRTPVGDPQRVGKGFRWKGWDRYNWLCTNITIPESMQDEEVVGLFDFGARAGTGNNSHFESLLYLNGEPYQGVDGNHREVFLKPGKNGFSLELNFRVWSGLNGGGRPQEMAMEIRRAQFGVLDHMTDEFYYLARTALEAYELLDDNHAYKEWILNTLVKAFGYVDYTEPGSSEFYESVKQAYAYLNGQMDGRGKPEVEVTLLGHTHIDAAWLWRLCHTREKAARSFSSVNRLMEEYGQYTFLQSQAQLYEFIKEDYPDIYEKIKERAAQGRWEPSGSMWVECDCNLVSGESIIRQILMGKNFFLQEFGYENDFLWLPDVFGYSWALPQILKKSGVDTFMTTKISWNDTNKLPYDTFLWRGIDGTEVTTHFITTTDQGDSYYTYNGDTRPYAVKGVWDNYSNKDLNRDLLIAYGYGDGGGGPNRDMLMTMGQLNKVPGIPKVKTETARSYFKRLNTTLGENPMHGFLPVWDGELYLEFHRGTYTSQAYNKKMNRRMEYLLRDVELLCVLAQNISGLPYPREEIKKAWKIVLCHQFHDILPGSSIKEVYEDSHSEYERAKELLMRIDEKLCKALYQPEKGVYTVFNNANWKRSTYVRITETKETDVFTDADGVRLDSRWNDGSSEVYLPDIEAFSFAVITKKEGTAVSGRETENFRADTPFYTVSWNQQGQLTSIYDKEAEREVLPAGKCGNVLQVFEDKPRCFDAWELEPTIDLKKEEITNCISIRAEEHPAGIYVTFIWKYHKSRISQTMCLYRNKKRIDFRTSIHWEERQKLLKTAFPVDIRAVDARFDIQEGNMRRPITRNTPWEYAKFEVVAHKWVDLWETGYGMAVLNDCKYGHDIKEDTIRLTLLKSAVDPDYTADLGHHEFTYSILPHHLEWYQAEIEEEAFDLNNPLTGRSGKPVLEDRFLTFDGDNIVVDAVKKAENSEAIVVRFHEFKGARAVIKMRCAFNIRQWCECSLMEIPEGTFREEPVEIFIKPYEIKTIMINF